MDREIWQPILQEIVSVISRCPIHNGTLKTLNPKAVYYHLILLWKQNFTEQEAQQ